tara:strand:+ start:155 stop:502 length:348 start_codon:yes stop_codon:yes gene_type:complete
MFKKTLRITDDFITMLNHAKMICYVSKIEFDTIAYEYLRDEIFDTVITTEEGNIEELMFSAYLASINIKESNNGISTKGLGLSTAINNMTDHSEFLTLLDYFIEETIELPNDLLN